MKPQTIGLAALLAGTLFASEPTPEEIKLQNQYVDQIRNAMKNLRDSVSPREENSLRTAHDALGAKLLMIVPYLPVFDDRRARKLGREKTLEQLVRGFRIAVEMGKSFGLTACFETTPQEDIRLSGTEDCLFVLERVPDLGLVFDTANMLPHGDKPLEAYEALKPYIVHVHLKDVALEDAKHLSSFDERSADGKRMRLIATGKGTIPVKEIYHRMLDDGYQGFFALEYARPTDELCTFEQHAAYLEKHLLALE